jgi:3-keto-L-gulonate-6-phosphate decarboxylase
MRDAKHWAKEIEVKLSLETQGDYSHITLQIALERYRDEIIPSHRGADREALLHKWQRTEGFCKMS